MNKTEITENKYKRGKIYKLISNHTDKVYIGSSCELRLCNRLAGHRANYKRYKKGKSNYVTSYELIQYDDVDIILIESWPCNSKDELHKRERFWLENISNCVNKVIPTRTYKEYRSDNADKIKNYRDQNKEKINKINKEYREVHREDAKKYTKQHYLQNKETINTKRKVKVECECGAKYTLTNKARHCQGKKHQQHLNQLE